MSRKTPDRSMSKIAASPTQDKSFLKTTPQP